MIKSQRFGAGAIAGGGLFRLTANRLLQDINALTIPAFYFYFSRNSNGITFVTLSEFLLLETTNVYLKFFIEY